MATEMNEEARVRAWLVGQVEAPEEFAQELYDALGTTGGDERVLVRVDVVDGVVNGEDSPYNVVIPVDAATETDLDYVKGQMEKRGVARILTLRVRTHGHHPDPPHVAHGYITQRELDAQDEQGVKLMEEIRLKRGRQGASPGHSPWG